MKYHEEIITTGAALLGALAIINVQFYGQVIFIELIMS